MLGLPVSHNPPKLPRRMPGVSGLSGRRQGGAGGAAGRHAGDEFRGGEVASTESARQYKDATDLVMQETVGALTSSDRKGPNNQYVSQDKCVVEGPHLIRRLTPLECERLQGFPDGWTDIGEWVDSNGKKHKEADSPRYKVLGNSIALPFWQWMARRICAQYERTVTMASLFDGIGGFPLVFQRCGAVPVWASEIEEFPIAVTKARFPNSPFPQSHSSHRF